MCCQGLVETVAVGPKQPARPRRPDRPMLPWQQRRSPRPGERSRPSRHRQRRRTPPPGLRAAGCGSGRWPAPRPTGHAPVHQHHIRADRLSLGDPVQAVGSLPNHLHAGVLQHSPQHPPHRRVVIDQQHPRHSGSLIRRRRDVHAGRYTRSESGYTWWQRSVAGVGDGAVVRGCRWAQPVTNQSSPSTARAGGLLRGCYVLSSVVPSQAIWSTSHLSWPNPAACLT
jgi:hypothetical protein